MDEKIENEMETGLIRGFRGIVTWGPDSMESGLGDEVRLPGRVSG